VSPAARMRSLVLGALLLLLGCGVPGSRAQLSAPVTDDAHVSVDGNKFLQNTADLDKSGDTAEAT
jgi:hypothetical protein